MARKIDDKKLKDPKQISSFIKSTSPSVWIMFSLVLILLIGVIVVAFNVTIESTLNIEVANAYGLDNNEYYLFGYFTPDNYSNIQSGQKVIVENENYYIYQIIDVPLRFYSNKETSEDVTSADSDGLVLHYLGLEDGSWLYMSLLVKEDGGKCEISQPVVSGKVVTGEIKLASLLLG